MLFNFCYTLFVGQLDWFTF